MFVSFHVGAAGFFAYRPQAQAYLLLFSVHLDDFEVQFLSGFQLDRMAFRIRRFRVVAESLDAFCDLNERTELRHAKNFAVHYIANAMRGEEGLPGIRLELLDAQRETALFGLNAQHNSLYLLALLQDL